MRRVGVLAAALIATAGASASFGIIRRLPPEIRARQLSRTADDLVDLSDESTRRATTSAAPATPP